MNFLMAIGTWFGQNILTKPEFFVGLLVFVGYLFSVSYTHLTLPTKLEV